MLNGFANIKWAVLDLGCRGLSMEIPAKWLPAVRMLSVLLFVAAASGTAESAFAQTFEDARKAFEKQDYQTALRILHELAEQGDAQAQLNLGSLYTNGLGVPKNNVEAANWTRKAANQGLPQAQVLLGLLYENGQGVRKNNAEAVKLVSQGRRARAARGPACPRFHARKREWCSEEPSRRNELVSQSRRARVPCGPVQPRVDVPQRTQSYSK